MCLSLSLVLCLRLSLIHSLRLPLTRTNTHSPTHSVTLMSRHTIFHHAQGTGTHSLIPRFYFFLPSSPPILFRSLPSAIIPRSRSFPHTLSALCSFYRLSSVTEPVTTECSPPAGGDVSGQFVPVTACPVQKCFFFSTCSSVNPENKTLHNKDRFQGTFFTNFPVKSQHNFSPSVYCSEKKSPCGGQRIERGAGRWWQEETKKQKRGGRRWWRQKECKSVRAQMKTGARTNQILRNRRRWAEEARGKETKMDEG